MKYRICLSVDELRNETKELVEQLSKVAIVDIVELDGYTMEGYDIFIGKKMSKEALEKADRLKVIFAYKTGVDDFPMDTLASKGIRLVNSHVDADYVAEYALGLSLSLVNRITQSDKNLRKGIWHDVVNPYWDSLFSMKVGILGYGHIGRQVHRVMARNHIECYTIDRGKEYADIQLVDSLEELCRQTDLIVASLPKTDETNCIINKDILKPLKGKYIVNVGRSNCIDHGAIYEALKNNELAGFANDTWDYKPQSETDLWLKLSDYPFVELDNVIVSPHQATRTADGYHRYVTDVLQKVLRYIHEGVLTDEVDLMKKY